MRNERGMGSFKALLALALFAALIYLGIKLVPPFFNNWQFQDDINTLARFATYGQGVTEESIRQDVLKKAKELNLPIKPEQIQVVKSTYGVNIDVKYNVIVETPAYVFNLKFSTVAGNKMITAK